MPPFAINDTVIAAVSGEVLPMTPILLLLIISLCPDAKEYFYIPQLKDGAASTIYCRPGSCGCMCVLIWDELSGILHFCESKSINSTKNQ